VAQSKELAMRTAERFIAVVFGLALAGCDAAAPGADPTGSAGEPAPISTDAELGHEPLPPFLKRENPIYPAKQALDQGEQSKDISTIRQALSGEFKTSAHGGSGGNFFNWPLPDPTWRLGWLYITYGDYINSIEAWWIDPSGNYHWAGRAGGYGPRGGNIPMGPGEVITHIEGWSGKYVDNLQFFQGDDHALYPFLGGQGGTWFKEDVGQIGKSVHGFYGRAGNYLDQIGFYAYSP
jgi:hypothetical protein